MTKTRALFLLVSVSVVFWATSLTWGDGFLPVTWSIIWADRIATSAVATFMFSLPAFFLVRIGHELEGESN